MNNTKLSQYQEDVIVGTLLGDASLQTGSQGKTWRYRALHSKFQREYLELKYEALNELCGSGIIDESFQDPRMKTVTNRCYFNTLVDSRLKPYADMFYKLDENTNSYIKDVPMNIGELLTPRALAFLYQDDGALKDKNKTKAMRICTESFSKEGVERLRDAIKNNFDIETSLSAKYKKTQEVRIIVGYRLYIPARSGQAFCDLIREYVVDCLKYKLSC